MVSSLFGGKISAPLDIKKDSTFAKYLKSHVTYELYQYAVAQDKLLGVNSDDKYIINPGLLGIIIPIEMKQGEKHPSSGVWVHSFKLTRGGVTRTYNVCLAARKNNSPKVISRIMGNTRASIVLEADVLPSVKLVAKTKIAVKNEKEFLRTFLVIDSKVIKQPVKKDKWIEKWTVSACGQEVPVTIEFTPDGQGGSFFSVK